MPSHDQLFKLLLEVFFFEFLHLFFPQLARILEKDAIEFMDKELGKGVHGRQKKEVDVVARLRRRDTGADLLIHVEIQSQPMPEMRLRMFHYFSRLLEKHTCVVVPIALLTYAAPEAEEEPGLKMELPDEAILSFRYRQVQLSRLEWRNYLRSRNPIAIALMAKMRIARADRAEVKFQCMSRLAGRKSLSDYQRQVIAYFVDTYLELDEEERKMYDQKLRKAGKKKEEEIIDLSYENMRLRGVAQGRAEGLALAVKKSVQRRFTDLSARQVSLIDSLKAAALEKLLDDLMDFSSKDDLDKWLSEHGR